METTSFDFETLPPREGTGSLKWQKYQDRDVLPMWVADMDFLSPPEVIKALHERVDHGVFGYTVPHESVENAVIEYLKNVHSLAAKREWLIWMPGLVPALNTASRAFDQPGESVMTNTPVYPPFLSAPGWQNRQLISVDLKYEGGRYTFDFESMEQAITRETRLFILCNPHNPVGRVFTKQELQDLVQFCKRHGLVLVSDEIHCDLILNKDCRHETILNVDPWAYENSLTMMAPSKTYNIPGLSCSFILIPDPKLRLSFQRASRGMITEVNCLGYAGCEAAYRYGEPWRQELLEVLRSNRDYLYSFIEKEMPKIRIKPMESTYLAWLDVRELGLKEPDVHFENHGVGLSNGALFGAPGWLRLNFGCPPSRLKDALARMKVGYDAI